MEISCPPQAHQTLQPFASLSQLPSPDPNPKTILNSPNASPRTPSPRPPRELKVLSCPNTTRATTTKDTPKIWVDLKARLSRELGIEKNTTELVETPVPDELSAEEGHSSPSYSTSSSPRKSEKFRRRRSLEAPNRSLGDAPPESPRTPQYLSSMLRRRNSLLNGLLEHTDGGTRDFAQWFKRLPPEVRFDQDIHNNFEMDYFDNPFASAKSLDRYLGCLSETRSQASETAIDGTDERTA